MHTPRLASEPGYTLSQGKGAKFPLFSKIDVNGPNAHPIYQKLKKEASNKTLMSMFGEHLAAPF
jgi:glutathione peroxidase-family protein